MPDNYEFVVENMPFILTDTDKRSAEETIRNNRDKIVIIRALDPDSGHFSPKILSIMSFVADESLHIIKSQETRCFSGIRWLLHGGRRYNSALTNLYFLLGELVLPNRSISLVTYIFL